jgi:hypothetical protein
LEWRGGGLEGWAFVNGGTIYPCDKRLPGKFTAKRAARGGYPVQTTEDVTGLLKKGDCIRFGEFTTTVLKDPMPPRIAPNSNDSRTIPGTVLLRDPLPNGLQAQSGFYSTNRIPKAERHDGKALDRHISKQIEAGELAKMDTTSLCFMLIGEKNHALVARPTRLVETLSVELRSRAPFSEGEWVSYVRNLRNKAMGHRTSSKMPTAEYEASCEAVKLFLESFELVDLLRELEAAKSSIGLPQLLLMKFREALPADQNGVGEWIQPALDSLKIQDEAAFMAFADEVVLPAVLRNRASALFELLKGSLVSALQSQPDKFALPGIDSYVGIALEEDVAAAKNAAVVIRINKEKSLKGLQQMQRKVGLFSKESTVQEYPFASKLSDALRASVVVKGVHPRRMVDVHKCFSEKMNLIRVRNNFSNAETVHNRATGKPADEAMYLFTQHVTHTPPNILLNFLLEDGPMQVAGEIQLWQSDLLEASKDISKLSGIIQADSMFAMLGTVPVPTILKPEYQQSAAAAAEEEEEEFDLALEEDPNSWLINGANDPLTVPLLVGKLSMNSAPTQPITGAPL